MKKLTEKWNSWGKWKWAGAAGLILLALTAAYFLLVHQQQTNITAQAVTRTRTFTPEPVTVTPSPAPATPTDTGTAIPATETPEPYPPPETQEPPYPAITDTPTVTSTATPTETMVPPTPTEPPGEVDYCGQNHPNVFHDPVDLPCGHHGHGQNPLAPEMKAIFNQYGFDLETRINEWGILRQNPWPSNPTEEFIGYTWAYFENHACTQGGPQNQFDFSEYACITDVLSRFHTARTLDHLGKVIHSESRIVKVCNKMPDGLPGTNCMILDIPAMHKSYGVWAPAYKQVLCRFLGDPRNEDGETQDLLQANYRTSSTAPAGDADNEFSVLNYWVAVTTDGVLAEFYDHQFNGTENNISWADEVWQLWPGVRGAPDVSFCGPNVPLADIQEHLMSVAPPIAGAQPVHLQLFDLRYDLPNNWTTQSVYWMDLYGNPAPAGECSDAIGPTPLCVPWQRWGPFVWQLAALNFGADERGDCDTAPCFIQETNGVPIIFPPDDGQEMTAH